MQTIHANFMSLVLKLYICVFRQKGGRTRYVPTTTLIQHENQARRYFPHLSHCVVSIYNYPGPGSCQVWGYGYLTLTTALYIPNASRHVVLLYNIGNSYIELVDSQLRHNYLHWTYYLCCTWWGSGVGIFQLVHTLFLHAVVHVDESSSVFPLVHQEISSVFLICLIIL